MTHIFYSCYLLSESSLNSPYREFFQQLLDYFGPSIEADPSKVGKNNVHFIRIGSIPRHSSGNHHIARQKLYKQLNLEPPKLRLYQLTKHISDKIAPHIFSALRNLGVISDKFI